jgi:hypothetical protein
MRSSTFFGLLATLATLTVAVPVNQPAPLDNTINPAFPYGSTQVRGVNLGGWLVLEVYTTFWAVLAPNITHSAMDHPFPI